MSNLIIALYLLFTTVRPELCLTDTILRIDLINNLQVLLCYVKLRTTLTRRSGDERDGEY